MNKTMYYVFGLIALAVVVGLGYFMQNRNSETFKETATGLHYRVLKKGTGPSPEEGEVLLLEMSYKKKDGTVLFSTTEQGLPASLRYSKENMNAEDGGFGEAVSMLKKGDNYIFKLSAEAAFGEILDAVVAQHKISKDDEVLLELNLQNIMTEERHKGWEVEQIALLQKKERAHAEKQIEVDTKTIIDYLEENKIAAKSTEAGVYCVVDVPGKGPQPKKGDKVKISYTGKLLDGKVFDTSLEDVAKENNIYNKQRTYEPIEFELGAGKAVPGMEDAVLHLKKGDKARVFIPSTLAYGSKGVNDLIPGDAVLLFEITLVDVKK